MGLWDFFHDTAIGTFLGWTGKNSALAKEKSGQ